MKISSAGLLSSGSAKGITPDFKIHTSAMEIDPEHANIVHMVGSSTERDLHGDTMAVSALSDMAQVEPGLTIWLNHSYNVPNDLFGSLLESPRLELQNGIADIHITSDAEMDNPAAVQTLKLVKNGRKMGCSIGCMILEAEVDNENDDGMSWWPPLIILHVQVLEWSVVGIPANQRCWAEMGTKGLFERMVSEGRGDEALALAPAVKGLYPRAYDDYLKKVDNQALKRDLERIEIKAASKQRIEWKPDERLFAMNTKGVYKPMQRNEVSAFMAKSGEKPRVPLAVERIMDDSGSIPFAVQEVAAFKGASGKTSWPLADEDAVWDKGAAHKRIMEWAGGDDPDWAKVKSVHFWFDDEKADTWGGYKLPFCDKIDDAIKAVPHAIYACTGGHGLAASDIPDDDVPAIKKKIETYYHKLGKKAPWEEDDEKSVEPGKESNVNHLSTTHPTNAATASTVTSETVIAPVVDETTETAETIVETDEEASNQGQDQTAVVANTNTGSLVIKSTEDATLAKIPLVENPANPLDMQLFNALAARFGQPVLTLDAQGQVSAPKAFPELTPEAIQEVIAKTLNFGETVKSGSQFSKKNQQTLQSLHNSIVDMCKSQFHPCEEMDDGSEDDGDDGDEQKQFSAELLTAGSEIPALREDFKALIDTLKSQGHLVDPKAVKDMQGRIDAADRRLKDIQATTKTAEERLANLQNAPLGQPTLLKRGIQNNGDIVTHEDFKSLAGTMNANERRWSLDEALRETTVIPRTLASGEAMNYRKWPQGVGGSVENGVRPALTKDQRGWMHPAEWLSYDDGNEAFVPCYDDPLDIQA